MPELHSETSDPFCSAAGETVVEFLQAELVAFGAISMDSLAHCLEQMEERQQPWHPNCHLKTSEHLLVKQFEENMYQQHCIYIAPKNKQIY